MTIAPSSRAATSRLGLIRLGRRQTKGGYDPDRHPRVSQATLEAVQNMPEVLLDIPLWQSDSAGS